MEKDLHFYPCKTQLTQELKESDHKQRRDWSTKLLQLNVDGPNFWRKLKWRHRLAPSLPRFNGTRLFPVGVLKGTSLCKQAHQN
ncbi:hypothetical protein WH47_09306 [Habropoda laboriosa]|uniref:Uncharacterized protein n=1 Tax=Habropoda laboriosa TaxID=597456 RepID=A0A0L7R983_9HYME|nr:hypothetical protein WH47_09306 [Habropoda laboriosa]